MDLMKGGDLRKHHRKIRMFTEDQARFFIACMIEGLEEVHDRGILHRDLKPENLVFDQKGYLRITDFGIARLWAPDNGVNNSGTPGYMAPEVMERQNHSLAADYFALGVMGYEFMMGRRPFLGKDKKEIYKAIQTRVIDFQENKMPEKPWSAESKDFIKRCLHKKPCDRLGFSK